jgi:flavodoxin
VLTLLGSKQGRQIQRSETQLNQFYQWLDNLKDGTMIKAEYKIFRAKHSDNQRKAHFGLVVDMIRQQMEELGWDICGVLPNKKMIHEILKKCCGGVGSNGETMGLSEMDTEQASKFFENCRTWAASQLSLNIPDPDPNWKSHEVR